MAKIVLSCRNRVPVGRIIEQGYIDKITRNTDYMEDTGKFWRELTWRNLVLGRDKGVTGDIEKYRRQ